MERSLDTVLKTRPVHALQNSHRPDTRSKAGSSREACPARRAARCLSGSASRSRSSSWMPASTPARTSAYVALHAPGSSMLHRLSAGSTGGMNLRMQRSPLDTLQAALLSCRQGSAAAMLGQSLRRRVHMRKGTVNDACIAYD